MDADGADHHHHDSHHLPSSLAGPREAYGSQLEWAAAARRRYLAVLAVACPVHGAAPRQPCLDDPERVCGVRVRLTPPAPAQRPAAVVRQRP